MHKKKELELLTVKNIKYTHERGIVFSDKRVKVDFSFILSKKWSDIRLIILHQAHWSI